jgi:hypothetical protein
MTKPAIKAIAMYKFQLKRLPLIFFAPGLCDGILELAISLVDVYSLKVVEVSLRMFTSFVDDDASLLSLAETRVSSNSDELCNSVVDSMTDSTGSVVKLGIAVPIVPNKYGGNVVSELIILVLPAKDVSSELIIVVDALTAADVLTASVLVAKTAGEEVDPTTR